LIIFYWLFWYIYLWSFL